jgi:hypothetical protein
MKHKCVFESRLGSQGEHFGSLDCSCGRIWIYERPINCQPLPPGYGACKDCGGPTTVISRICNGCILANHGSPYTSDYKRAIRARQAAQLIRSEASAPRPPG